MTPPAPGRSLLAAVLFGVVGCGDDPVPPPDPSATAQTSAASTSRTEAVPTTLPTGRTPPGWSLPPYAGPPVARLFEARCVAIGSGEVYCALSHLTEAMTPEKLRPLRKTAAKSWTSEGRRTASTLVRTDALKEASQIWSVDEGGCASFPDGSLRCWGNNDNYVFGEMLKCREKWVYGPSSESDSIYRRRASCPKPTVVEGIRNVIGLQAFRSDYDGELTEGETLSLLAEDGRHYVLGYDQRDYARSAPDDACSWAPLWRPTERVGPLTRCLKPALDDVPQRFRKIAAHGNLHFGDSRRLCGLQHDGVVACWGGAEQIVLGGVVDITEKPIFFRTANGLVGRIDVVRNVLYEYIAEGPFPFPATTELISGVGVRDDEDKITWLCGLMSTGRIVCALGDRKPVLVPLLEDIVDLSGTCALRKDGAVYCFKPGPDGWTAKPLEFAEPT